MKIEICQTEPFGFDKTFIKKLFAHIERTMPRYAAAEVSVAFVDTHTIRTLNRRYRQKDKATDVLSFAERDSAVPQAATKYLGEIVIAYPYARRQAQREKRSIRAELSILLIHGFFHLAGHDHINPKERAWMEKHENKILSTYPPTRFVHHHANIGD